MAAAVSNSRLPSSRRFALIKDGMLQSKKTNSPWADVLAATSGRGLCCSRNRLWQRRSCDLHASDYVVGVDLSSLLQRRNAKLQSGETALPWQMLGQLKPGDTLVADCFYCTYWIVVACKIKGINLVMKSPNVFNKDCLVERQA